MRRVEWRDAGAASESRHSAGLEPLRFELPNLQIERLRIEDLDRSNIRGRRLELESYTKRGLRLLAKRSFEWLIPVGVVFSLRRRVSMYKKAPANF
jgi:hypothetical protein